MKNIMVNHSSGVKAEGTKVIGRASLLEWRRTVMAGDIVKGRGDQKEGK